MHLKFLPKREQEATKENSYVTLRDHKSFAELILIVFKNQLHNLADKGHKFHKPGNDQQLYNQKLNVFTISQQPAGRIL